MSTLLSNPWDVREADFPRTGLPAEQLRFLLHYAVLAPSGHNTQPWLFKIDGDTVELSADLI
jgi:nitroreductase